MAAISHAAAEISAMASKFATAAADFAGRVTTHKVSTASTGGKKKVVLVALGGNALLERGEEPTAEIQARHAREAALALRGLVEEEGFSLCVTHGNGPQVGLLALQAPEMKLDVLGAESEGQIGYLIERELGDELPQMHVAALLTQTLVDREDPAFKNPTKFIGPMYSEEEANRLKEEKGWAIAADGDKGFRRVVASPKPLQIVEAEAIKVLLHNGIITICAGGGGIPVAEVTDEKGLKRRHLGIEAVVDKDAASALLAAQIDAEMLLLLTDTEAVLDPSKWPHEKVPVKSPISREELSTLGNFAAGSMGPKVEAACQFVKKSGNIAGIGALSDAVEIVRGKAGTLVVP